ncbi:M15 family metallopeptidase [Alkaliphilus peptidifermentans]|uniref:D-alanyl-D-alanine carboxypeptidase n=1 Tax=Alkaliphilus peptidifermentans DSM 18978 TaxID=1120976 RepID=A0A1G5FYX1_9FIRM|nr:M15 family metallopeptidase [Alkaliphilus peptidifermentans]SCY44307.1 D-alanyl-D-alanine carboxypeptidase [Alkaliphilus peptidifermentans DSM 18978]
MKKYIKILLLILISVLLVKEVYDLRKSAVKGYTISKREYIKTLKQDIFSLMMAYPEYILDIEVEDDNQVYLILKSGTRLLYNDGNEKTASEKLHNPDLQDMLEERYVLGSVDALMSKEYNPGRIRVYPLLREVYGANQGEIEKNLVGIKLSNGHHRFNDNNSAAYYLKKAMAELDQLIKDRPEFWGYIYPIGGTYNYRYISKTNMLSPHSFGITIDLAIHKDDYWQWTTRKEGEKRLLSYPIEIVDIMESNYFIWGGKWGYFDILHFEYRPEIIIKSLYFPDGGKDLWYEGLPVEDAAVNRIILLIEERLQYYLSDGVDS